MGCPRLPRDGVSHKVRGCWQGIRGTAGTAGLRMRLSIAPENHVYHYKDALTKNTSSNRGDEGHLPTPPAYLPSLILSIFQRVAAEERRKGSESDAAHALLPFLSSPALQCLSARKKEEQQPPVPSPGWGSHGVWNGH